MASTTSKPGDHSIVASTKAPIPTEQQEDGPLYVHFLPRKEYLEARPPPKYSRFPPKMRVNAT